MDTLFDRPTLYKRWPKNFHSQGPRKQSLSK